MRPPDESVHVMKISARNQLKGTVDDTYRSLADRVQSQTGIPYLLIDGRFENTPATLRLLGDILDARKNDACVSTGPLHS